MLIIFNPSYNAFKTTFGSVFKTGLTLHVVPLKLMAHEAPLFLCTTPAGFPSPAQDDMEKPIDLASWLIAPPAASYLMRVSGHSMTGAGINDGDLVVVSRAVEARAGDIVVALFTAIAQ